ncbi:MAG: ribokinase [Ignavibacteria bacterium]
MLVAGSANMDLVVCAERFPQPGETIFGEKFEMHPGGKGANQAFCCAKLGAKTYFIGKMGNDDFGKRLSANMLQAGVNLDHLLIDEKEHTGTALIYVDGNGENEIIVISGSNMKLTPRDIQKKKDIFSKVKVVIAQLEIPLESVEKTAEISKENGAVFILNPAPAKELPEKLISLADYITPNEIELEILSGTSVSGEASIEKAAGMLLKKGVKNIIVTMGEKGAFLINKEKKKIYPSKKVKVVDSTGAGDAFNGALAYALSKEKEIGEAIQFAIAVASYSVTKMGAQSSMPELSEVF